MNCTASLLCEAAPGNRKERDRGIEREGAKGNEEGRLSQAWQPV